MAALRRFYRVLSWRELPGGASLGPPLQALPRCTEPSVAAGTAGGIAVDWALAQVGTPYIGGGETPGVGFDCSGPVQAAYKVAGITLPRTAQEQYDATAKLGPDDPLEPGDLVFFGGGATDVTHVSETSRKRLPSASMDHARPATSTVRRGSSSR